MPRIHKDGNLTRQLYLELGKDSYKRVPLPLKVQNKLSFVLDGKSWVVGSGKMYLESESIKASYIHAAIPSDCQMLYCFTGYDAMYLMPVMQVMPVL